MLFTQNLHKTIKVKVIYILTNRKTWIVKWHHFRIKALSTIIEASIFFLIRSSLEAEKSSSNVFCMNCVKKDVKCFSSIYLLCNKEVVPSIFVESVFFFSFYLENYLSYDFKCDSVNFHKQRNQPTNCQYLDIAPLAMTWKQWSLWSYFSYCIHTFRQPEVRTN